MLIKKLLLEIPPCDIPIVPKKELKDYQFLSSAKTKKSSNAAKYW